MNHKEVVLDIFESAWHNQEYDKLHNQISLSMKLHSRGTTHLIHPEKLTLIIDNWKEIFPDLQYKIIHLIEENEIVAINTVLEGTPVREWRSFKPNGKSMAVPHAFFFKFEGGKITDVWEINDFTVLGQQLG